MSPNEFGKNQDMRATINQIQFLKKPKIKLNCKLRFSDILTFPESSSIPELVLAYAELAHDVATVQQPCMQQNVD